MIDDGSIDGCGCGCIVPIGTIAIKRGWLTLPHFTVRQDLQDMSEFFKKSGDDFLSHASDLSRHQIIDSKARARMMIRQLIEDYARMRRSFLQLNEYLLNDRKANPCPDSGESGKSYDLEMK